MYEKTIVMRKGCKVSLKLDVLFYSVDTGIIRSVLWSFSTIPNTLRRKISEICSRQNILIRPDCNDEPIPQ